MKSDLYDGKIAFFENKQISSEVIVDKFNTEIFGITMANLSVFTPLIDIQEVEKISLQRGINHLSTKVSTSDKELTFIFQKNGYLLVDTLVVFKVNTHKIIFQNINQTVNIRVATISDLTKLISIGKKSFSFDRFHSDPTLSHAFSDNYYGKWIENSVNGYADYVLVAELDNKIVGFLTCKITNSHGIKYGQIVLNAVSDSFRGRGVYRALVQEALKWFKDKTDYITIGTQINNYPVHKVVIDFGFHLFDSQYIFHKLIN